MGAAAMMHSGVRRRTRGLRDWAAGVLTLLALWAPAGAKIDLVTLPQKDTTQLTIYKSEDLTLVRETRELTFRKGLNQIQFSWANTLIDPTSLQIDMKESPQDFRVLDAVYPANSQNTIVWNIEAAKEGKARAEITFFASGLTWRADYTAIANDDETALRIEPDFTITNNSGEDFENARTRLVVGEINLVQAIAELARQGIIARDDADGFRQRAARSMMKAQRAEERYDMAAMAPGISAEAQMNAKEILKAAVSEYYLYSIEGEENLQTGWGKQLPNPRTDGVKIDVSYEYNPIKYGGGTVKFYKFKNDADHRIGEVPLPEGQWYVYSGDTRGGMRFQGSWQHKYVPIGEDVELNLGSDGLVIVEERQMDLTRTNFEFNDDGNVIGYDIVETREIEVRNSRPRPVPMKITLKYGTNDWEATDATVAFRKVDRETLEWKFDAPALDKQVIRYKFTTRTGSRDRTVPGYQSR